MTGFLPFVTALEELLSDAGYSVVRAFEEIVVGSALVSPSGETDLRDARPDGFTPVCDVIIGAAQTRDYTARMDVVAALDRITELLWESDIGLPSIAQVLVRPRVGGIQLGTDEQPIAVIIVPVTRL